MQYLNLKKASNILFFWTLILFISSNQLIAEDDEEYLDILKVNNTINKDWVFSVYPFLGICEIDNKTWMTATMSMSDKQVKDIVNMMLNKTAYDNRSALTFLYEPSQQNYVVSILSGEIELSEGEYSVVIDFDNAKSHNVIGYVAQSIFPEPGIYGETYKNIIGFQHKNFLRNIVPDMKRYKSLTVKVGSKILPNISLLGFTKAYSEMQKCMGEAVSYELVDPF